MSIQIIINGESAEQIREHIAGLSGMVLGTVAAPVDPKSLTPVAPKQETPKTPKAKKEELKQPETQVEMEINVSDDDMQAVEKITDVELRELAGAKGKAGKKAEIKALLAEYGVQAVTAVPGEDRPAFKAALEAL